LRDKEAAEASRQEERANRRQRGGNDKQKRRGKEAAEEREGGNIDRQAGRQAGSRGKLAAEASGQ
jgi:hypothetical protein